MSCFNIENKHGNLVAKQVINSIKALHAIENVTTPANMSVNQFLLEAKEAIEGVDLGESNGESKKSPMSAKTFLNRILGCPVDIQNSIFNYFDSALEKEIATAKREGRYENGVENIDLSKRDIIEKKVDVIKLKDNRQISFNKLRVKDGMTFKEAFGIHERNKDTHLNGFYYARYGNYTYVPVLMVRASNGKKNFNRKP